MKKERSLNPYPLYDWDSKNGQWKVIKGGAELNVSQGQIGDHISEWKEWNEKQIQRLKKFCSGPVGARYMHTQTSESLWKTVQNLETDATAEHPSPSEHRAWNLNFFKRHDGWKREAALFLSTAEKIAEGTMTLEEYDAYSNLKRVP